MKVIVGTKEEVVKKAAQRYVELLNRKPDAVLGLATGSTPLDLYVELAKLCRERLDWKRTTTYTVVKRLCERGILRNDDGIVTSLVSKGDAQQSEIDELVEKRFEGSLPAFIAAFTRSRKLSEMELDEVQSMID